MGKKKLEVLRLFGHALQTLTCLPTACQPDLEHPHGTSQGLPGPCSTKQEQLLVSHQQMGGEEHSCLWRALIRSYHCGNQLLARRRGRVSRVLVEWLHSVCPSHTTPDPCSLLGEKCLLPWLAPWNQKGSTGLPYSAHTVRFRSPAYIFTPEKRARISA